MHHIQVNIISSFFIFIFVSLITTCKPFELKDALGYNLESLQVNLGSQEIVMFEALDINWNLESEISSVRIDLYKGDELILTFTEDETTGSYTEWTVPRTLETGYDYRVIITSNDDPTISIESDAITILTYFSFGGNEEDGGHNLNGHGAWIDEATGKVFLTGSTRSSDITGTENYGDIDILLMKLNRDLSFDSAFGQGGLVRIGGLLDDYPVYIGQDSFGSVYVSSTTESAGLAGHVSGMDLLAIKMNPNGALDSSFYDDGMHIFGGSAMDYANGGYIDEQNNFYIFGRVFSTSLSNVDPSNDTGTAVTNGLIAKYGSTGILDITFDLNGVYMRGDGPLDDLAYCVSGIHVESNGDIVWCGVDFNVSNDATVGKIDVNGVIDASFGTNGKTTLIGSGLDEFNSMAVDSNGNIYAVGHSSSATVNTTNPTNGGSDILVAKFLPDGNLDSGFAEDGILLIGGSGDEGYIDYNYPSMCLNKEDKVYIVSASNSTDIPGTVNEGLTDCFVVRLNSDGSFDTSFDDDGKMFLGGSSHDRAIKINATESGRVYVSGFTSSTNVPGLQSYGGEDFFLTVFHE